MAIMDAGYAGKANESGQKMLGVPNESKDKVLAWK